ncbi:hypothetical protein A2774_02595 [Candidatus Roizmanbacteria bacterium RIFCSPHIGHO2_01_FULL_39_12c]|uniref:Isochorismatase-like domain-containing protein n=1 Tax=Candidatus Roizmanbacteria bacterium RIFCSPHIGHO2_01_FULL_39_12c TaxID=1802031 RepID=A0A1F7GA26_9BACT|nr:MAG: hypothetical protein A2774_02595 [Candidatus Roizmanbacteria bacterium RIFCSPHIGHO2_01_FULL_39_12c]OGK47495.1 MAG: hypothetical protein A2963_01225 [Candidatus Roizmanbacteria bacterium RIFCSPLOWO2_01_FULL_40_13]
MNKHKALLITDMIDLYIKGEKPLVPIETRQKLIFKVKKAVRLARSKKIPLIYINSAFRGFDPIYKLINYREQSMEKRNDPKVIDELKPGKNDYVLKKRGYDGFWLSGLEKLLKKLRIKDLYLTGCQTDCCIRETAVTASHLGYNVYVLKDCCQTNREFGQIAALRFFSICSKGVIEVSDLKKFHFT